MKSYKDSDGRLWHVHVDIAAAKRLRSMLGLDLNDMIGEKQGDLMQRLQDPLFLCDAVYVTVKPQADSLGMTDEMFGAGHTLDDLEKAAEAWWEAVVDFFPQRLREVLRVVVREAQRVGKASENLARKMISEGKIDALVQSAADEAIVKMEAEFDRVFGTSASD